MKFDYLKLAEIIKNTRMEKGISTRNLAEKIGISHAEISRFENGLKPNFYFIPFIKMLKELDLDVERLLNYVGLYERKEDKRYEVKITNVEEDYFTVMAQNECEAAEMVAKVVIDNEFILLDSDEEFIVEVEELQEEFEEDDEEIDGDLEENCDCKTCKFYCSICDECTYGE